MALVLADRHAAMHFRFGVQFGMPQDHLGRHHAKINSHAVHDFVLAGIVRERAAQQQGHYACHGYVQQNF